MKTEKEYLEIIVPRLKNNGYSGQELKSLSMLLRWSYVEGSLDADVAMIEKLKALHENQH